MEEFYYITESEIDDKDTLLSITIPCDVEPLFILLGFYTNENREVSVKYLLSYFLNKDMNAFIDFCDFIQVEIPIIWRSIDALIDPFIQRIGLWDRGKVYDIYLNKSSIIVLIKEKR